MLCSFLNKTDYSLLKRWKSANILQERYFSTEECEKMASFNQIKLEGLVPQSWNVTQREFENENFVAAAANCELWCLE